MGFFLVDLSLAVLNFLLDMKKISYIIIIICFFSCGRGELECSEWEREQYVSNDFFDWEWECVPILHLYTYHGNWNAQVNIVDQSGNSYFYELDNLSSSPLDLNIMQIDYPLNGLAYYQENGYFPDDTYRLSFVFLDPKTLEFTVNDTVFDPHIESSVIYNGAGQIINNSGSANAEIQFNCNYSSDSNNYTISFSATRGN